MSEMSLGQLTTWTEKHDDRHEKFRREFVSRELYNQAVAALAEDVADIKEAQKWAMRLIVTILLTNLLGLLYFLVTQSPG
jgi:hypothetical protein